MAQNKQTKNTKKTSTPLQQPKKLSRASLAVISLALILGGYFAVKSFAGSNPNPYRCPVLPKLGPNSTDTECIRHLKWYMKAAGYSVDPTVGEYSDKLKGFVADYQKKKGLEQTGVVGARVWDELIKDYTYVHPPALGGPNSNQSQTAQDASRAEPPTKPNSLTVTVVTATSVELKWKASTDPELGADGVAGYRIIRDDKVVAKVQGGSTTQFTDTTVMPGSTYKYSVRAVDVTGNLSPETTKQLATTPNATRATKPSTPTQLFARQTSNTEARVSWAPSGGKVAAYKVYSRLATGYDGVVQPIILAKTTPETHTTVQGLKPGEEYSFFVAASTGAVDSEMSQPTAIMMVVLEEGRSKKVPVDVGKLKVEAKSSLYARISWELPKGDNIAAFGITRSSRGINTIIAGGPIPKEQLYFFKGRFSYNDAEGLKPGTPYSYTVVAYDKAGNSGKGVRSTEVTLPQPDHVAPTPPTKLRARVRFDQVSLRWTPSTDEGTGVAGYSIVRGGQAVGYVTQPEKANTIQYTDKGKQYPLTPGSHTYGIVAYDYDGNVSPARTQITVVVPTQEDAVKRFTNWVIGWWPIW